MTSESVATAEPVAFSLNDDNVSVSSRYYQRKASIATSDRLSFMDHYVDRKSSSILTHDKSGSIIKKSSEYEIRRSSILSKSHSNSRFRMHSKNQSMKRFSDERKAYLRKKFVKTADLCIFCYKWAKWAYNKINETRDKFLSFSQMYDFESASMESSNNSNASNDFNDNSEIVSFNKDYFKSKRKTNVVLNISNEVKQILAKLPGTRSKSDIEIVRTSLKYVKSINALPLEMQNKVYKKCWLEEYESKRVIIKQSHRAEAFYFVLSGSLVVTNLPDNSKVSYTVCFLETGMSFGELALLSKSLRTSTVTSRTRVELLAISKEDFYSIFTGEKKNSLNSNQRTIKDKTQTDIETIITDNKSSSKQSIDSKSTNVDLSNVEFLRKLDFLNGWPCDVLLKNPQSIVYCYFPRGQVLVRNANYSKYIYIVKKGSISVWIKLKRKKENADDATIIRKYLTMKQNDAKNDDEKSISEYQLSNSQHENKEDDLAVTKSIGGNVTYFESDDFLKDQHNETLQTFTNKNNEHISNEQQKNDDNSNNNTITSSASKSTPQKPRKKANFLAEYMESLKGKNIQTDNATPKGVKVLPGALDKRDKLRILDVNTEDDNQENDNDPELVSENSDLKTFSKGHLHLPNIIKAQAIRKKSYLRKSSDDFKSPFAFNTRQINDDEDRRKSQYTLKLPTIDDTARLRKIYEDIPKKKFKTAIEMLESNEANSRRESLLPTYNFKIYKKDKTLNTTHARLSGKLDEEKIKNENLHVSFNDEQVKKQNEKQKDEYVTEYIEVQVIESGCHFGLAEILFESQPNMSLVSNGCDCILLPKELFMENATTTYLRHLRRQEIPYPTMPEIMKSYNEFSSWKKYTSQITSNTVLNTKRFKHDEDVKLSKSFNLHFARNDSKIYRSSMI